MNSNSIIAYINFLSNKTDNANNEREFVLIILVIREKMVGNSKANITSDNINFLAHIKSQQ